jgi:hypothetical protein
VNAAGTPQRRPARVGGCFCAFSRMCTGAEVIFGSATSVTRADIVMNEFV